MLRLSLWAKCRHTRPVCLQFASELELLSEIHFSNVLIFQNGLRRSGRNQAAVAENIRVPADSQGLPNIMVGDQHPDSAFAQVPDDALDIQN